MLLTELVPPGAVAAGAVLAAGELLAPLGVALVAGAAAAAPAVLGNGLAGGGSRADGGLPAAPSITVTATAPPLNAAMTAASPPSAGPGRSRTGARRTRSA